MANRKRLENESYEDYRRSLKVEARSDKIRAYGRALSPQEIQVATAKKKAIRAARVK